MDINTPLKDYEINLLWEDRELNQVEQPDLAYYYTRNMITYMGRLVFAIGWSKLRERAPDSVNRILYAKLFKAPDKRNSVEPGKLGAILRECAREASLEDTVRQECYMLGSLGTNRNSQSHDDARADFAAYFSDTERSLQAFERMFANKRCAYIIPLRYENQALICYKLESGMNRAEKIMLDRSSVPYTGETGNRLFYQVVDQNTAKAEYYCLSPFIEVPNYLNGRFPHFLVYAYMENSGYGSDCIMLRYNTVYPTSYQEDERGQRIARFDSVTAPYLRAGLFSRRYTAKDASATFWYGSSLDDVYINISNYPDFDDILHHQYSYCAEICPARQNVLDFCKDKNRQALQITGNGGVGKTALTLSVICDLSGNRKEYGFSNLIFLSAKKSYYSTEGTLSLRNIESSADIHGFADLILKLAALLDLEQGEQPDIEALAEGILAQVSDSLGPKRFLLVIDDLDSLPREDQKRILDYVHRFSAQKLKTLITTRDFPLNPAAGCQIRELNPAQSLKFAKWYAENKIKVPSWDSWSRRNHAESSITKGGEGNPLIIEMLLSMVSQGAEMSFDAPMTRNERIAYMYNTVQNLLEDSAATVFYLCRRLYLALPEEMRNNEMLLAFPEYLAAGCGIERADFTNAMERLRDMKLLSLSRNGQQFQPYSLFILSDDLIHLNKPNISRMYELIWSSVSKDPRPWISIGDAARTVSALMMSAENDPLFDTLAAKRILEHILAKDSIAGDLRDTIVAWNNRHDNAPMGGGAVANNDLTEQSNRLIQRIETTLDAAVTMTDATGNIDALQLELMNDIRRLHSLLKQEGAKITNAEAIQKRLRKVNETMEEYGL